MNDPAMIIDIIFLAVLIITAVRAYIDGFFTSVIRLVGTLGSVFAGWYVSTNYTGYIFENYLRAPLTERSYNFLLQASRDIDIKTALTQIIGNWPQEFVTTVLAKAEEAMAQLLVPTMDSAVYLVNEFIQPMVTACLSVVLFLVCFAAVRIVCSLLAGAFKTVNKVPVLGTANRLTGFASGIVMGCVNIILLSFLLSIIVIVTGDSLSFLNAQIIADSRVMAITSALNPFLP